MKLIDEGIARLSEQAAAENWPNGKLYNAIYCMGLERAAKVAEPDERKRTVPEILADAGTVTRLIAERDALRAALNAACVILNGRAYFKAAHGVPMEMPKKTERIVRASLAGTNDPCRV